MMQAQKQRLGRGLAALIGDDTTETAVLQDIRSLRHLRAIFRHKSAGFHQNQSHLLLAPPPGAPAVKDGVTVSTTAMVKLTFRRS